MSQPDEQPSLLAALFNQLEAGHQAATNKPTRDELETEFASWFTEAGSNHPSIEINAVVDRMDY